MLKTNDLSDIHAKKILESEKKKGEWSSEARLEILQPNSGSEPI